MWPLFMLLRTTSRSSERNEALFAFSIDPGESNFLTAMLLVLFIYVLYESF
jgi:hypothetical protein